jgi:hypothetical protein
MSKFSHESHGVADRGGHQTHSDGTPNIARDTKVGKRVTQVPHAFGMSRAQTDAAGQGGIGHAVTAGTPGAAPLPHAYGNAEDLKSNTAAAPPSPGMKSQQNADTETHADKCKNGADMMSQATKC